MKHHERGATLILMAFSLLLLMIFTGFVLDQGTLWAARREAQNSADAAALAAGTGLLYDAYGDRTSGGPAHLGGMATGALNLIMGAAPGVIVEQSLDAAGWTPPAPQTCLDAPGSCAQASVFRDGTNGSTLLPVYFSGALGVSTQKVRATATVQMLAANAVNCMKPWMAPDKTDVSTYTFADVGTLLPLRMAMGTSHYAQIDMNRSGADCPHGGGRCYGDSISECVSKDPPFKIGDIMDEKRGGTGGPNGETLTVYQQDPLAYWDAATKSVQNSCAERGDCACAVNDTCANGMDGRISPRIIAVALFAPSDIAALGGSTRTAPIKNFAGIFMLQPQTGPNPICTAHRDNVCGYLMPVPGVIGAGATPAQGSTLNVMLSLIR